MIRIFKTVDGKVRKIPAAEEGSWVAMTNHTWAFSIAEMKNNLGYIHLAV